MSRSAAALLFLAAAVGCGGPSEPSDLEARADAKPAATSPSPGAVETHDVELGNVAVVLTASGTIAARRVTEIVPEVQGRLIEVLVDVGDEVRAGDVLFRIDPSAYQMALADARAGLAVARAEAANAAQEATRVDKLAEESAVSDQRVEQLQTQSAVAKARAQQAEARLARAQRDLALTRVDAPYDGSIVERNAHEGAMAGAGAVLVLQESGALEAILDIPEASGAPVRVGDPVSLRAEGVTVPIESRVRAVSRRVDPGTRTYEVRAPAPDPDGVVKVGSFVQAEIEPSLGDPAPVVPRAAVRMRDGRTTIFRVVQGRVEQRPVRLGRRGPRRVQVVAGVEAGDRIVVGEAVQRLSDGARVELAPPKVSATTADEPESGS